MVSSNLTNKSGKVVEAVQKMRRLGYGAHVGGIRHPLRQKRPGTASLLRQRGGIPVMCCMENPWSAGLSLNPVLDPPGGAMRSPQQHHVHVAKM